MSIGVEQVSAESTAAQPETTTATTRTFWPRFRANKAAVVALVYLGFLVVVALTAPWISPHPPNDQELTGTFLKPSSSHWLGTDDLGRDMLSRIIYGARISVRASLQVVGMALAVAVPLGLIAGYVGGRIDTVIMRLMDAMLSFPALILALAIAGVLGPGLGNAMIAISIVMIPSFVRLIRAQTLAVRQETFIEASQSLGTPTVRIVRSRVLPNVASPLIVQASIALGAVLLAEAALSFLGLGLQPPDASWGSMLRRSYDYIFSHPWHMFIPGTAIALTVLAFNAVGDGLQDAFGLTARGKSRSRSRGLTAVLGERRQPDEQASTRPLLDVRNLSVEVDVAGGPVTVVDDVSFSIGVGETLGLVGESGSGKTVTSLAVMRLLASPPWRVTAGSVEFDGQDLLGLGFPAMRSLRGDDISMVFQDPMTSLNPAFRVLDQVAEAVRWHEDVTGGIARRRALDMLDAVGIPASRARSFPHEFSGGMRQRAMIALALVCRPKLLIADEPTTALDVTVQAQILELLRGLQDELGMALLLVTHDLGVVADTCDRVAVMYAGQLVEQATVDELFSRPRHPYTDRLLAATPANATPGQPLAAIPGQVPQPGDTLPGCLFAPRCPHALPKCTEGPIPLIPVEDGRVSRCIRVDEIALGPGATQ